MPTVKFVKEKQTIEVPEGSNLRREARANGVGLYSGIHKTVNCRGLGQCGSCVVKIVKGEENVAPPGLMEKIRMLIGPLLFFTRLGNENKVRLACKTIVQGDIEVETHAKPDFHGEKFWE